MTRFSGAEEVLAELREVLKGDSEAGGAWAAVQQRSSFHVDVARGQLTSLRRRDDARLCLRMVEGRRSAAFSMALAPGGKAAVKAFVGDCRSLLRQSPERRNAATAPAPLAENAGKGDLADTNLATVADEEKINRALNLEAKVLAASPKIFSLGGSYEELVERDWIWTIGSTEVLARSRSCARVRAAAAAGPADLSRSFEENSEEVAYYDLDWTKVARDTAAGALRLQDPKTIPSGRYRVLFAPEAVASILEALAPHFRGDFVAQGRSRFAESLGKRVFAPNIQLSDKPRIGKRFGSRLWDAEGTPTHDLAIVREGSIVGFAHTYESAIHAGVAPSGSARLPWDACAPVPGFHTLVLEAGAKDHVDLLRDTGKGLLIEKIHGPLSHPLKSDNLVWNVSASWIEGGSVGGAVSRVVVEGDPVEILSKAVGVGRDLRFRGAYGAPSLLVEDLLVKAILP